MVTDKKVPKRWTEEEDTILQKQVLQQSNGDTSSSVMDWNRVAEVLPSRSNKDCRKRWVNRFGGERKFGIWDHWEDTLLLEAIKEHGPRWSLISNYVGSRSPDQCSKRWEFKLNPKLDRGQWSTSEDHLLSKCVAQYGRQWKRIQEEYYPARSRNDLKNRYTILGRRSVSATGSGSITELDSTQNLDVEGETDLPSDSDTPTNEQIADEGNVFGEISEYLLLHGSELQGGDITYGGLENDEGCWNAMDSPLEALEHAGTDTAIDMVQDVSSADFIPPPSMPLLLTPRSPEGMFIVPTEEYDTAAHSIQDNMASLLASSPPVGVDQRNDNNFKESQPVKTCLPDVIEQQKCARNFKVTLVINACDQIMLDRLLEVIRMTDWKSKVEIEF